MNLSFIVASSSQSNLLTSTIAANEDLSDLSDDDEQLYPDGAEVENMKFIRLRLNPTSNPKIQQLFLNTDKVITSNVYVLYSCQLFSSPVTSISLFYPGVYYD